MYQTKKSHHYYFRMKAHIGVDDDPEDGAPRRIHGSQRRRYHAAHKLLHGREETLCGNSGYNGL